jgi:hypothetical protein
MKVCDNYEAKIWLGLQEGYTQSYHSEAEVSMIISKWCTEKKQCVTVSPTKFIYVNGSEPGLEIGFINYPRYQNSEAEIRNRAQELANLLMKKCKQYRVSITFYKAQPGGVMMLENEEMTDI